MGTLQADSEAKQEFDDSGCVQDASPSSKMATENGYVGQAQLLDLSDDVLLYILRHCTPRDLKALGFTCPRLGSLVLDHTLWQRVDARSQPSGRARVRWYLAHAIHPGTRELMLSGYAREAKGCRGHVNRTREKEMERGETGASAAGFFVGLQNYGQRVADLVEDEASFCAPEPPQPMLGFRHHALVHLSSPPQPLPRLTGSPSWPENISESEDRTGSPHEGCAGPQFTLNLTALCELRMRCKHLTTLCLEYCNINCKTTGINQFPATLKKLSLRGTKCYNPPLDKSILFKIHDYLPVLEYLDVSECSWLEPASLLALSKMHSLQHLLMRHCYTMTEFVAYASLATRYGFRKLKVLDLSGSPVGDSEVSALGWIPALEELYLSPGPSRCNQETPTHCHYKDDPLPAHTELDEWETEEPEYFKMKQDAASPQDTSPEFLQCQSSVLDIEEKLRIVHSSLCLHGNIYTDNMYSDAFRFAARSSDEEHQELRAKIKRVLENGDPDANPPGLSPKRKRPASDNDSHNQNGKRKSDSDNSEKDKMNVNEGASTSKMSTQSEELFKPEEIKPSLRPHNPFSNNLIPTAEKTDSEVDGIKNSDTLDFGDQNNESEKSVNRIKKSKSIFFRQNQEPTRNEQDSDSDSDESNKSDNKNKKHKLQSYVRFRQNQEPTQNEQYCNSDSDDGSKKSFNKNKKPKLAPYVLFRQNQEPTQNEQNEISDDSDGSENSVISEDFIKPIILPCAPPRRNQLIPTEEKTDSDSTDDSKTNSQTTEDLIKPIVQPYVRFTRNQLIPTEEKTDSDSTDESKSPKKSDNNKNEKPKPQAYVLFRQNQEPVQNVQTDSSDDTKKTDNTNEKNQPTQNEQNDDSDDDEKPPPHNNLNQQQENSDSDEDKPDRKPKVESYVHFRQYQQPVVVQRHIAMQPEPEPIESRQHILYVNVGEQLRAVYRLHTDRREHLNIYTHHTPHLGSSSLVTDSAVRRFGRADGEDVNYVHIGPNGPYPNREVGARPDRSNLRILSITGYRYITDRSLVHLATAAPNLRLIDFSDTGVTEQGVERFRSIRPDCEVKFSTKVSGDNDESE